jgi:hypothetical protein
MNPFYAPLRGRPTQVSRRPAGKSDPADAAVPFSLEGAILGPSAAERQAERSGDFNDAPPF